jgi:hypothetical protein
MENPLHCQAIHKRDTVIGTVDQRTTSGPAANYRGRIIGRRHDRTPPQNFKSSKQKTPLPKERRPDMTVHLIGFA